MKKFFFLASVLMLSATCLNARTYVQTGKEGDPQWDKSIIGEDANVVTFTTVADLNALQKTSDGVIVEGEAEALWFAGGTYVFESSLKMSKLTFVGGFKGTETSLEERELGTSGKPYDFKYETILDGQGTVQLIFDTQANSLDGLTLTNSNRTGNGGICRLSPNAVVKNCKALNNVATGQGGAFMTYNAAATYENCYFEGNKGGIGGALYTSATSGDVVIRGCAFVNNETTNQWGNVCMLGAIKLTITNCIFSGNTFSGDGTNKHGAALAFNGTNEESLVANNLFVSNENTKEESVILVATGDFLYNTVIDMKGGAFWQKAGNCKNNVFYAATAKNATVSFSEGVVYTNNAGVNAWKEGADETNIVISLNNKPAEGDAEGTKYAYFADPDNHDFSLQAGSALINAGVAIETITTDIIGEQRKNADIGAYAYNASETAVENTAKPAMDIRAALEAGEVYNILGQRVSDISAGNIYIVSGQKMLVR